MRFAHVALPATAWGEKDGTVTNSERRISRQRPFLGSPGEARHDWAIIAELARRMGFGDAFAYETPAQIFAEHAALSALENDGARDFDIGALAKIGETDYDALSPFQWPRVSADAPAETRFFAQGGFFTPTARAGSCLYRRSPRRESGDAADEHAERGRLRRRQDFERRLFSATLSRLADVVARPEEGPDDLEEAEGPRIDARRSTTARRLPTGGGRLGDRYPAAPRRRRQRGAAGATPSATSHGPRGCASGACGWPAIGGSKTTGRCWRSGRRTSGRWP